MLSFLLSTTRMQDWDEDSLYKSQPLALIKNWEQKEVHISCVGNYNSDCILSLQKVWEMWQIKGYQVFRVFCYVWGPSGKHRLTHFNSWCSQTSFCFILFKLFFYLILYSPPESYPSFVLLSTVSNYSWLPYSNSRLLIQTVLLDFTGFSCNLPPWFTHQVTYFNAELSILSCIFS